MILEGSQYKIFYEEGGGELRKYKYNFKFQNIP